MDRKVIFLDIDGTLIATHEGEVSFKVKQALRQARENGHYVFLCTGRNQKGIQPLLSVGFDGVICSAGGYIEVQGQKIFESHIEKDDVKMIQNVFDENHILYSLESDFHVYRDEQMSHLLFSLEGPYNSEIERMVKQYHENNQIHSLKDYNENDEIQTICFITHHVDNVLKAQEIISQKCQFLIYQQLSDDTINGEIMKRGIDKGFGVKRVMEALGLPLENSIGFGDSMNDLEMIKTCHHGVVMGNGDPRLKKYATSICESVEDDGIYHELYRLGLCHNKNASK